jgi:hypothetical protein
MEDLAQQVVQSPRFQPRQFDGVLVVEREERGPVPLFDRQDIGHVVVPGQNDAERCAYSQFRLPVAVEFGMMPATIVFLVL